MSSTLDGTLAVVTGASRGIGAATARALAAAGAHVVLTARTAGALEAVEDAIHAAGGSATIAPLDLTEGDSIARLAFAVSERWQRVDTLVLNAAMLGSLGPVATIEPKEFARLMTLNVTAQQATLAAFDPLLRDAPRPRVIAVTSSVGRTPRAFWGAYGASKAAFETLVESYGEETRNIGDVRVAIVDPGATRTEMRARAYPGEDPAGVKPPEHVADAIIGLLRDDFPTGHRFRFD